MEKLNIEEMESQNGGGIPRWLSCGAGIVGTGIFFAGITMTTGPVGLYAANAILGPTIVGVGLVSCFAKEKQRVMPTPDRKELRNYY